MCFPRNQTFLQGSDCWRMVFRSQHLGARCAYCSEVLLLLGPLSRPYVCICFCLRISLELPPRVPICIRRHKVHSRSPLFLFLLPPVGEKHMPLSSVYSCVCSIPCMWPTLQPHQAASATTLCSSSQRATITTPHKPT